MTTFNKEFTAEWGSTNWQLRLNNKIQQQD